MLSFLMAAPGQGQANPTLTAPPSLNQHRINEFAASCADAQAVFKGLKGIPRPGETPAQFTARIKGYFDALEKANNDLTPLRQSLTPRNSQPENLARWKTIADEAKQLPLEVKTARLAWKQYPQLREKAQVGQKLLLALNSLQALLTALRDARP